MPLQSIAPLLRNTQHVPVACCARPLNEQEALQVTQHKYAGTDCLAEMVECMFDRECVALLLGGSGPPPARHWNYTGAFKWPDFVDLNTRGNLTKLKIKVRSPLPAHRRPASPRAALRSLAPLGVVFGAPCFICEDFLR